MLNYRGVLKKSTDVSIHNPQSTTAMGKPRQMAVTAIFRSLVYIALLYYIIPDYFVSSFTGKNIGYSCYQDRTTLQRQC